MSGGAAVALAGRDAEIRQFDALVRGDGTRWVMLVDGLSGTGKRELLAWLRRHRTEGMPSARIQLSANADRGDRMLQQVVSQLDPRMGETFAAALTEQASEERRHPLLNYAPTYEFKMSAGWGGSITSAQQTATPALELGPEYLAMIRDERRERRLALLERTLAPFADGTIVLFVSDAEHLDNQSIRALLLDDLVRRLRETLPGFRLYLTGSTVPREAFAIGERLDSTLEPLTRAVAVAFLREAGLGAAQAERGFELTLGHPLLLRLYLEGMERAGSAAFTAHGRVQPLDERTRTQWIHDSVLSAIPDTRVRAMAEELTLLEWFDASLLRAVFEVPLSDREFEDLVRRSFIKALPNGRWRCHDVIRTHLRVRLVAHDPVRVAALQRKLFDALEARLALAAEREGGPDFPERLDLAVAAVLAAAAYSIDDAVTFTLSELAVGLIELEGNHVFAFANAIERSGGPAALVTLGRIAKETLQLVGSRKWSDNANTLLDRLATHALNSGREAAGATLLRFASLMSGSTDRHEAAVSFARRAVAASDTIESRLLLARVLTRSGATAEAADVLKETGAAFGDSAALRVAEGSLALAQGDSDEAVRRFGSAVAAFPGDSIEARMRLASLLADRGESAAALVHVDAILEQNPEHEEASSLRLDLLAHLGRIDELIDRASRPTAMPHVAFDIFRAMTVALADPRARGRVLAMLELDPAAVASPILFVLCDVLANEGDVDRVMALTSMLEQRHREARPLCDLKRASALAAVGRDGEAAAILEPMVNVGITLADCYFVLAGCYQRRGEAERMRDTLRRVANLHPSFKDTVDAQIAGSLAAEGRADDALAFFERQESTAPLGPLCRTVQARLVAPRDPDRALLLLEEIIHTYGRGEMPLTLMIAIRLAYGQLLAVRGRRDDAARVAGSLREHFGAEDPAALVAAATIHGEIGDAESLWTMFTEGADAHPRARTEIVQRLIGLVLARKPAVADLLRALEANPNRIDMLGAALLLAGVAGNRDEIRTTVARIEQIAPATLATYNEIWTATMALASPGELAGLNQIAQEPGSPMLAIGITRMLGASKKISVATARQTFRQLVEVNPGLADDAASAEAQMLLTLEQTDEAALVLASYLEQNDPPEPVLPAIVGLRTRQGDYAATERVLRRIGERFPEQRRSVFEGIVDLKILEARHEEALALLADMEAEAPLDYGLLFSRAVALADLNRYDEALAALQRAEELPGLTPQRRGALGRKRGAVLRDSGRLDESIAAYKQAIGLIPRDGAVRIGLAKTLQKAGRWQEAYETMLDGVALAPAMLKTHEADLRELHRRAREPRDGAAA